MSVKPIFLLLMLLFAGFTTQAYAEQNILLSWEGTKVLEQGVSMPIIIKITNNSPTEISALNIQIHYSWMPPNTFVVMDVSAKIEPNTTYICKYEVVIPSNAKTGTSSDYAFYLKYVVSGEAKYTNLVRITANIIVGKSIYSPQIIDLNTIIEIIVGFSLVCIIVMAKKEEIVNWINLRKSRVGMLVFLISFIVYVCFLSMNFTPSLSNMLTQQGFAITGDESHYLLMSKALLSGKIDGDSIYENLGGTFRHIHNATGILFYGLQVSNHPYGMPLLSAIPYLFGQVTLGSGAYGVLIFMCAMMAINSVIIYKISMYLTKEDLAVSVLTSTAFSFATIMFMWSGQFFTENFMSVFILFAVYKFMVAKTNKDWILGAVSLGFLPFIKYQTIFVVGICLFVFGVLYLKGKKEIKYSIVVLCSSVVAYLVYLYTFIGVGNITMLGSSYTKDTTRVINIFGYYINKTFYNAFFGLFLDRNYGLLIYSPILILSALGIVQAYKNRNVGMYIGATIFVSWIGAISCFTSWMGWITIPGKYVIVVAPLLCIPFALGLKDFKNNKYYIYGFLGLFLAGLIPNILIASNRILGYVMSLRSGIDYNWYLSALEQLGFPTKWIADFNNIQGLNGANVISVTVFAMLFVLIVLIFAFFSYKKTFLDSNNLENISTAH